MESRTRSSRTKKIWRKPVKIGWAEEGEEEKWWKEEEEKRKGQEYEPTTLYKLKRTKHVTSDGVSETNRTTTKSRYVS